MLMEKYAQNDLFCVKKDIKCSYEYIYWIYSYEYIFEYTCIYINTDMNRYRYILKWAFKKVWVSKNKSKF